MPKVSVCIVTYNQEEFIEECLDSVFSQETSFDFEVIVSDDCSTDNTPNIIERYKEKHPNLTFNKREVNVGPYVNFVETHEMAKGEYVCHLDGDDYWYQGKLQAQADFLDRHADCNIVFHRMNVLFGDGVMKPDLIGQIDLNGLKFYRQDLLQLITIGFHSSKMYRSKYNKITSPGFDIMDYFANVINLNDGWLGFVNNECFGVYRGGIGIASDGSYSKKLLSKSMGYFFNKYPQHRSSVRAGALLMLLASLKNARFSDSLLFVRYVFTLSIPSTVMLFINKYPFIKLLKLPR